MFNIWLLTPKCRLLAFCYRLTLMLNIWDSKCLIFGFNTPKRRLLGTCTRLTLMLNIWDSKCLIFGFNTPKRRLLGTCTRLMLLLKKKSYLIRATWERYASLLSYLFGAPSLPLLKFRHVFKYIIPPPEHLLKCKAITTFLTPWRWSNFCIFFKYIIKPLGHLCSFWFHNLSRSKCYQFTCYRFETNPFNYFVIFYFISNIIILFFTILPFQTGNW